MTRGINGHTTTNPGFIRVSVADLG